MTRPGLTIGIAANPHSGAKQTSTGRRNRMDRSKVTLIGHLGLSAVGKVLGVF